MFDPKVVRLALKPDVSPWVSDEGSGHFVLREASRYCFHRVSSGGSGRVRRIQPKLVIAAIEKG